MENTKALEDENFKLRFDLDSARVKCTDLEDEVNELKYANRQLEDRNHWLEGKVEAFEFCVKNGRAK